MIILQVIKFFKMNLVFHKASYFGLLDSIKVIIDSFKLRSDYTEELLSNWINLNSYSGYSSLLLASSKGNLQIIKILIENGADINAVNFKGMNVLHHASQYNQPHVLVYFLDKYNFDINSRDNNGSTPLHWACFSGSEEIFNFLISRNECNINSKENDGFTPLHLAVVSESIRIVKKLLQHECDTEIKNNHNKKAIDLAHQNKRIFTKLKQFNSCNLNQVYFTQKLQKSKKYSNKIVLMLAIILIIKFSMLQLILIPVYDIDFTNKLTVIIYLVITFMILINYFVLVFSNPGIILKNDKASLLDFVDRREEFTKYCPKCVVKREEDSIHCLVCDRCIKEFDHHCFWVNNCIGKNNFKIFIVFLILLSLYFTLDSLLCFHALISVNIYTLPVKIFSFVVLIFGISFVIPICILIYSHFNGSSSKQNYFQEDIHSELKESLIIKK